MEEPANTYRHTSVDIVLDNLQEAIKDLTTLMRPEVCTDEVSRLRAENARLLALLRANPPPRPQMLPQRRLQLAANQEWRCALCEAILGAAFHADHIIPYSASFDNRDVNIQIICVPCHLDKTSEENSCRNKGAL